MSELQRNVRKTARKGVALGATVGAALVLSGCEGCDNVTPVEAEKKAIKQYKSDFAAASPAVKFAMQYTGVAKYDIHSSTDFSGYDYFHAIGVGSACLKNSVYNPEKGSAVVRTSEDNSDVVTVELVKTTIEGSELVFSGAVYGESLQPDADTERVLRETYHCPVPYEPQITSFESYSN